MGKWSEISARDLQILREDVGLTSEGRSLSLQFIKGPGKKPAKGKSRKITPRKGNRAGRK
jgi:hypothetical protein